MTVKEFFVAATLMVATFLGVGAVALALKNSDTTDAAGGPADFTSRAKLVGGGTPPLTAGLLAGRPVETEAGASASRRPIAVMIDNNVGAVPQSGLARAEAD